MARHQRLRVQFAKEHGARYISHLDLQRALERALRRAEIPFMLSQGFNPHPRLWFGPALAVGATSEAEYVDIDVDPRIDPIEFERRLMAQMPPGLRLIKSGEIDPKSPGLASAIDTAAYLLTLQLAQPLPRATWDETVQKFLTAPQVVIERETKSGRKPADVRPLVHELRVAPASQADGPGDAAGRPMSAGGLHAFVQTGSSGANLRPADLVAALSAVHPDFAGAELKDTHRTGLFRRGEQGRLLTPWEW